MVHGNPGTIYERRVRQAGDLGVALRLRRREQGLTQEDVGLLAGTHRNRIQEIESGATTERIELLLRVLNEVGLELIVRPRDAHRGMDA